MNEKSEQIPRKPDGSVDNVELARLHHIQRAIPVPEATDAQIAALRPILSAAMREVAERRALQELAEGRERRGSDDTPGSVPGES